MMCRMPLLSPQASANWVAQVVKHVQSLGFRTPFAHDGTVLIDKPSFRRHAAGKSHEVWQGLHASPRSAPSKGAKLCTYHRWFARIRPVPEPYFQLPISDKCIRRLFCFRLGAYALPQWHRDGQEAAHGTGCPRLPSLPRLPRPPGMMQVGDERHYVFECPAFDDIRRGFQHLFDDSCGAMRLLIWHVMVFDTVSKGRCFLLVAAP